MLLSCILNLLIGNICLRFVQVRLITTKGELLLRSHINFSILTLLNAGTLENIYIFVSFNLNLASPTKQSTRVVRISISG